MDSTSNWKLGATSDELQKVSSLLRVELAHGSQQVAHALAIKIVPVVCLDRVHKC